MYPYPNNNRVHNKPYLITTLRHNLDFAADAEVNTMLLTRYNLYDYITPNDSANKLMLQSVINAWSDYANKLYATTLYDYNPIENYNRVEEAYTDTHHRTGSNSNTITNDLTTTNNLTNSVNASETTTDTPRVAISVKNYENGYGSADASPSSATVNEAPTGTNTTTHTMAEADNYSKSTGNVKNTGTVTNTGTDGSDVTDNYGRKHITGNIGTMSTQTMIEQERSIIIDVLDFYVAKFAEAFDIAQDIAFKYFEEEGE